jgi:hypothetical protein
MNWSEAVNFIKPHVVRISTPRGSGTGFLLSRGKVQPFCVIATAAHVVDQAHNWFEPIRLDHTASGHFAMLLPNQRAVFLDPQRDTAAVLFRSDLLPLPETLLELVPKDVFLNVGYDLGWLGFPSVSPTNLCFFAGRVSAFLDADGAYLVDGVTIHGVSGGPAFEAGDKTPTIIGVVSAYIPNVATGQALPGVGVVRDVTQFHELAGTFASLDQAQAQQSRPEPSGTEPRRIDGSEQTGSRLTSG